MGRPGKPIDVLTLDGKKHLVKSEIEQRRANEKLMHSGVKNYIPSNQVLNNPDALLMFKKLKKLYKNISYVDGLDENIINRYCLIHSETIINENILNILSASINESLDVDNLIKVSSQISNVTNSIYKLREMLLKIEDRLLLNPTARIKNVPKKIENDKSANKFDKFGGGSMSG